MDSAIEKIRALVEDERDTAEHCIDIHHVDYLLAEIDRLIAEGNGLAATIVRQLKEKGDLLGQIERLHTVLMPFVDRTPVCVECGVRGEGNRRFSSNDGIIWRCADGCDEGGES